MKNSNVVYVRTNHQLHKIRIRKDGISLKLKANYFVPKNRIVSGNLLEAMGINPELLINNYDLNDFSEEQVWSLVRQFSY